MHKAGFQLCHAIHAFEKYLHNLSKRACVFHLVFFDSHAEVAVPHDQREQRYKYQLTRTVLSRHLRSAVQGHHNFEIKSFVSPDDFAFQNYLSESAAYFLCCHDGNVNSEDGTELLSSSDKKHGDSVNSAKPSARKLLLRRSMMIYMKSGLDIALIGGMEMQDMKVMSFVLPQDPSLHLGPSLHASDQLSQYEKASNGKVSNDRASIDHPTSLSEDDASTPETYEFAEKFRRNHDMSTALLATILALEDLEDSNASPPACAALLLHSLILPMTSITNRNVDSVTFAVPAQSALDIVIKKFCEIAASIISKPQRYPSTVDGGSHAVDLIDGRLLRSIFAGLLVGKVDIAKLPKQMDATFAEIWAAVGPDCGRRLPLPNPTRSMVSIKQHDGGRPPSNSSSILPFNNPVLDKHLKPVRLQIAQRDEMRNSRAEKIYHEVNHWHNSRKPITAVKHAPKAPLSVRDKKRLDRMNQRSQAEMNNYAESLTGSEGKGLNPELILVSSKAPKKKDVTATAKIVAGLDASKRTSKLSTWSTKRQDLLANKDPVTRYRDTMIYLGVLEKDSKDDQVIAPVKAFAIYSLAEIWSNLCSQSQKAHGFHLAALIQKNLEELSSTNHNLDQKTCTLLNSIRDNCGLGAPTLSPSQAGVSETGLEVVPRPTWSIGMDPTEFALNHAGIYMDRALNPSVDARVKFRPDGWQKEVLDELDAGNSLFVVAPTSSGKTFISFYAIEKVLRANDDGVVVYIAPTKALVNQIAAEVQARFKKTFKYAGKSVYAIHTRDYRVHNPISCQVLVTVPHILSIMLLSPTHAKTWVPRVKTVIFDEVHSIGQAEDGVVWEQLLMMAPDQVIALSATVGNPQAFSDWLSVVQGTIGRQLKMVQHHVRYSDLRKYEYSSSSDFEFVRLPERRLISPLGLEDVSGFELIHPVACLTNRHRGIPDDLSLESTDCLSLYEAFRKAQTPQFPIEDDLSPSVNVPEKNIAKVDILKWGAKLTAKLREWIKDPDSPFEAVVESLQHPGNRASHAQHQNGTIKPKDVETDEHALEEAKLKAKNERYAGLMSMLCSLHGADALPAILFNYDRSACEKAALHILSFLVKAEENYKSTDAAFVAKVAKFEQAKVAAQRQQKKTPKEKKGKGGKPDDEAMSKIDRMKDEGATGDRQLLGFDPTAPLPEFSFADVKRKGDSEEFLQVIDTLKWKNVDPLLIAAFERGIGVHHSGMTRKYRQAVEIWFRKRFLRVIIATGTLSLGINMPCKTVVFFGDSVYLTALNYRQAAGRAGRRGFDLLGNVVFLDVTRDKINRLVSSRLPDLNGHFPLTTTLVLRLLSLLHTSGNAPSAVQVVDSLLSQPRLYLGGESFKQQVLHHVRFSIEYLRSQDLIGSGGEPINFTPCVSHLYFTENSAFAFHALLRDGYFHGLAAGMGRKTIETLRTLMIVMAHLFGRRPFRQADWEQIKALKERSSSVVFLPPLPSKARDALKRHNNEILNIYTTYVRTYAEQYCHDEDRTLPFSKIAIGPSKPSTSPIKLPNSLPPTKLRSPFTASSGFTDDDFASITDLCSTVRDGIFLEKGVIPHLDIGDELREPLNAYLYDFYQHGNVTPLEKANGIRKGDIWYLLNDFSLVLATLVASFESYLGLSADVEVGDVGGAQDMEEMDDGVDDDEELGKGGEGTSGSGGSTGSMGAKGQDVSGAALNGQDMTVRQKKKKSKAEVVDDWEAAVDEEEGESDAKKDLDDDDDDDSDENDNGDDDSNESSGTSDDGGDEKGKKEAGIHDVYVMMRSLKENFDGKFRKIFA
ncbi:hypothetical protein MMC25_001718 [Agyrium rufum]|nr:hypothetical protein [Agyrium rufum]